MLKKIRTIIVDDEPLARKGLSIRVQGFSEIEVVAECTNGREAIQEICRLQPDLVFLDIQMPMVNGFQVIQGLSERNAKMPSIVFVTAFDQYATKAFEIHALDYILKPVDDERLKQCIERITQHMEKRDHSSHKEKLVKLVSSVTGDNCEEILKRLSEGKPLDYQRYPDVMAIKDGNEVSKVKIADIIWVDAAGDYMCVNTADGTHILRKTMKELEAEFDPNVFVRIHRSIIVNKHFVQKLSTHVNGEYFVTLDNDKELKVSRSYRDKVKAIVGL